MMIEEQFRPTQKNYIFCILAMVLCLRHVLLLMGFSSVASMLFRGVYALTGLWAVGCSFKKLIDKQKLQSLLLFFLGIGLLFWALWMVNFRYRKLESAMTFFLIFPIILSMDQIRLTPREGKLYLRLMTVVGATLAVFAFVPRSYRDGILLLYTLNGNQSGLLYMMAFVCVFLYLSFEKKNPLLYCILAALFYGCVRTESRTSIMCCVLVVLLTLLLNKKTRLQKVILTVITCIYIILPFTSAVLVNWLGADFEILGASVWTGREDIWPYVLEILGQEPFGIKIHRVVSDFYGEDLGAHNTMLTVAWNYSVPFAIVFVISLFKTGRHLIGDVEETGAAPLVAFFAAGLLHMTFESALIVGALDYSLYFLLAMLAGSALKNERTIKRKEAQKQDET